MLYASCIDKVVCDAIVLSIRTHQRKDVTTVVCKQAPRHDTEHILVCRRMWLHGKTGNFLLSVGRTIFLQADGFLLHRLMAVGSSQLAVGIVILPGDVGLMTRLTVMPPELHHQMRCLHGLFYFGRIL